AAESADVVLSDAFSVTAGAWRCVVTVTWRGATGGGAWEATTTGAVGTLARAGAECFAVAVACVGARWWRTWSTSTVPTVTIAAAATAAGALAGMALMPAGTAPPAPA